MWVREIMVYVVTAIELITVFTLLHVPTWLAVDWLVEEGKCMSVGASSWGVLLAAAATIGMDRVLHTRRIARWAVGVPPRRNDSEEEEEETETEPGEGDDDGLGWEVRE